MFAALALTVLASTSPSGIGPLGAELAAIRATARQDGDAIWPGYGDAPFGFLLIEGDREILLCHPTAPPGFTDEGRDPATGCTRRTRARSGLPDTLLAAMPIFGPPSVIVMGTPEATGRELRWWRATIHHEHFHQWQAALPDYYARVAALDLSGGDLTGMWMLNFPFPYADPAAGAAYADAARALAVALRARGSRGFNRAVRDYLGKRRAFAAAVGERNWRYFEFQLWQEGIARWTENAIATRSADPTTRASAYADQAGFEAELERPDLARNQRTVVYTMGASEALLLEACHANWRGRYPNLLALGPLLDDAASTCRT